MTVELGGAFLNGSDSLAIFTAARRDAVPVADRGCDRVRAARSIRPGSQPAASEDSNEHDAAAGCHGGSHVYGRDGSPQVHGGGRRHARAGRPSRVRDAGRVQRLLVRAGDRGQKRGRRHGFRTRGHQAFRRSVFGAVSQRHDDRLRHVDAGIWLYLQESAVNRRLRLRQFVLGLSRRLNTSSNGHGFRISGGH